MKFEPGDIVLVSSVPKIGTTTNTREARPYVNQIGTIVSRIPRSMASPYYVVKFGTSTEVKVISLFLRGPYKSMEAAQKYKADPNLKEDPNDLKYMNVPVVKKEQVNFGRNAKVENLLKAAFGDLLTWNEKPEVQEENFDFIIFQIATRVVSGVPEDILAAVRNNTPNIAAMWRPPSNGNLYCSVYRVNRQNKKLNGYVVESISIPSMDYIIYTPDKFVRMPFAMTRMPHDLDYGRNTTRLVEAQPLFDQYLAAIRQGNAAYKEFLLGPLMEYLFREYGNGSGKVYYGAIIKGLEANGMLDTDNLSARDLGWLI